MTSRAAKPSATGREAARFGRFLGAGAVNAGFGYVVFILVVHLVPTGWLALMITYAIGLTFNFFVFSRFVFVESTGHPARFVGSYIVAFALNSALYSAVYMWLPHPALAQLICLPPVAIATYLLMRCWSFAHRAP